jgi:hypothetical protein
MQEQTITDVQVKPQRPIPRYFKDYVDIIDHHYGIEITRAAVTRAGKGWKSKMKFLAEILIGLDNIRRNEKGEYYYHLNASALIQIIQTIMNTCQGFHFDRNVQTIPHIIHAQPYWKKRDKKRKVVGYAVTHTVKVTKGGHFNNFEFPVSAFLAHKEGEISVTLPRDLVVNRFELIDCRKLYKDEHLGAGRITMSPDGKEISVEALQYNPATKLNEWVCAGKLQIA